MIAELLNPDPFRVPVIDLPPNVAVRFSGLNPGDDNVSPTEGAEYVPVIVRAMELAPARVPVPVTEPDVSARTMLNVTEPPPLVEAVPVHVPASVVLGPLDSPPLQAARIASAQGIHRTGTNDYDWRRCSYVYPE